MLLKLHPSPKAVAGLESPPPLPLWKQEPPKSRFTTQANVASQRAEARVLHEGLRRDQVRGQHWPDAYVALPEVGKKEKKRRWWQSNGGDRDLWR